MTFYTELETASTLTEGNLCLYKLHPLVKSVLLCHLCLV